MRTLASNRLLLRPWQPDDADFLLDLHSRWEVVRFLGTHPSVMKDRESALASIARRRAVDDPVCGIWAMTTASDGRLVGNLLLKPIPLSAGESACVPAEIEVGWHLHPDAWGHGYATEAARTVLDDAFRQGQQRVIAVTHPDNRASQAVCRRLEMTHLGPTTRYYDTEFELFEKLAR